MTPEVSCDVAGRWLSRAIDEEITPEEERQLESHLDGCSFCRAERERLFVEVELLESDWAGKSDDWAGVSNEIEGLLRERIGDDPISVAERAAGRAKPESPRPRGALLLAAATVVIGVSLFLLRDRGLADGPTVQVEWGPNGIEYSTGGRFAQLEGEGTMALPEGGRFTLPAGSEAWLTFADGSYSRFGEGSRLRIDSLESEVRLELGAGRAAFQVEPREGAPFVVLTALARIEVVGTRFGVVQDTLRTIVTVSEGEVRVQRRGAPAANPFVLREGSELDLTLDSSRFTPGEAFLEAAAEDNRSERTATSGDAQQQNELQQEESEGVRPTSSELGPAGDESSEPSEAQQSPRDGGALDMPNGGSDRPSADAEEDGDSRGA